jgi:cellulose synthase/poly-beta-1,6-N-acetylglucosamine synthase-like glycosyltransferase
MASNWSVGGIGEGSYWTYENALKRMESDIRSTLGATGAVYAIRKSLFEVLPTSKPVTDDFLIAAKIARKGFDIKYEPRAKAYEKPSGSVAGEFTRKVRIGAANLHGLAEYWQMLGPRFGFVAWALWSRKIIRWAVPFLLIMALVCSLILAQESQLYRGFVIAEVIFVAAAAVGFILDRMGVKAGFFGFPYYFLAMNSALFVGALRFLRGREPTTWKVVR